MAEQPLRIGVLALQGSFREHMACLGRLPGVQAVEVRTKEELASVEGLIIPGEAGAPGGWRHRRRRLSPARPTAVPPWLAAPAAPAPPLPPPPPWPRR